MKGLGTIVNAAAILLGGGAGLLFHKGIPPKLQERVMEALALGVILIGLSGALKGEKTLVMILSLAVGAAIGALLSIDDGFHRLADKLSGKLVGPDKQAGFAAGFVSASLLFCTGAMAVTGALQDGFSADHATLFAKALIDGISAMLLASALGSGVLLSAAAVFLYQGLFTVLGMFSASFFAASAVEIFFAASAVEMGAVGSLLLVPIGLNMLKVTHIKVMDLLPAIFLPIVFCLFL